jgi:hypothetical protein
LKRIEPYSAGGFDHETEHFFGLIREERKESPVVQYELSAGMTRLLEEARRCLRSDLRVRVMRL